MQALLTRNRDLERQVIALERTQRMLMRTLVANAQYQVMLEQVVRDAGIPLPSSTCIKKYNVPIDTKDC